MSRRRKTPKSPSQWIANEASDISVDQSMPHTRTLDFRNLSLALVALLGIIQFLGTLYHVASNYPEPYIWHRHFISDLGRTKTSNGSDNTPNSKLFAISSLAMGASMLPFLLVIPFALERGRWFLRILAITTILGLIGIGQTPYDKHFILHHVALMLWIVPMVILAIALPVLVANEGDSPLPLFILSGVLLVSTLIYASIGSHSGYVIVQKIVVVISLAWFAILASTVVMVTRWQPSDLQQIIASQAKKYERKLRKPRR